NVLNTPDGAKLQLVKVYDGELEILDEKPLPANADAAHTMSVSAVGPHLSATVGDTTVADIDGRLQAGGIAAFTHRRAAQFDDITVTEALDQDHWRALGGDVAVDDDQLRMAPGAGEDRAHVLLDSALPERFSQTCDYDVTTTV